jgi:CHAT domain-containing protein/tetratricopeptide (TPR) repeat protein
MAWLSTSGEGLDAAERECQRALDLARRQQGLVEEAAALGCVAEVMYVRGADLEGALSTQKQAQETSERAGDPRGVAQARYSQGYLYSDLRRFDDARAALEAARSGWQAIGDRRGLALTLVAQARLLERRGEYEESLAGYQTALHLLEAMGDALWQGSCLAGQAQVYQYLADNGRALEYFQQALRAAQTSGLKAFEWDMLTALGQTFLASGDDAEALSHFERARSLAIELGNPRLHAWALTYVGGILLTRRDIPAALNSYQQSLGLLRKGDEPWLEAQALTGLGEGEELQGQRNKAYQYFSRALEVSEMAEDRVRAAGGRLALGNLAARQGRLSVARASVRSALDAYRTLFGPAHPLVAEAKAALADVDFSSGRTGPALSSAVEAESTSLDHLRSTVRYLPERQALAFASRRPRGLDLAISGVAGSVNRDAAAVVYDLIVQSRGAILDELAARHRNPPPSDPALSALYAAAAHARQRHANLLVRSLEGAVSRTEFESARQEKEAAERSLAARSAEARAELERGPIGLNAVRRSLPVGTALLSFVQYARHVRARPDGPPSGPAASFVAFVMRAGSDRIAVVPLGSTATIEPLLHEWRSEAAGRSILSGTSPAQAEREMRAAGARLRRAIWDPVAPHFRGATQLFVVPDGVLGLLPLAALPSVGEGFLLEDGPPIHYLTTERDLVSLTTETGPGSRSPGMLALGGPAFDDVPAITIGEPSATPTTHSTSAPAIVRGGSLACGGLTALRFQPLNGTLEEVQQLSRLLPESVGTVATLVGSQASEPIFKREAHRYRVLHLATHGFFLDTSCVTNAAIRPSSTRGVGRLTSSASAVANPLLLSGLALAGANRRAEAKPDEDDGILTAEEVATLDLHGVEWAVLSACDTGVGEIKAGEGVFGLRRAFQVAGARTVIMSLWSVDDQATRAWMRALYEGRFQRQLSTADAVHQASLTVLRDRRARGLSTHPFFWAAFVAAGDWR